VNVNLPQVTSQALDSKHERLVVTLTAERAIYLDDVEVSRDNLAEKMKAVLAQRVDQQVYLRADQDVPYGFVMEIMAALKQAGVDRLGMVTEPEGTKRKEKEPKKESEGQ
ncbi:MAG: biopolymer transporter ExbD, partial [Deltaproteobacteria bacterium]|nr:biopolymer transporter ExbD [Deltaproteobacteria bacterium]